MKKIIIAQIMGKWFGGGVESIVMNCYRNINREKFQFDFICDSDSTNIPYEEIEKLGGRVILVPPYQKILKYNKVLTKLFNDNKYEIVHSHINALSIFPLRIAKKCGVPVRIAHSHSTTNKKEWKKNIVKQILKRFSKVYANKYMCCTEFAGRWLFGDKTFNEGKVYILNNAIELEKFVYNEEVRKKIRNELNIKDDTLVVGHIGRFVPQKNHTFLVDIFNEFHKKNKNSILLLIGQGPLMDEIKEKINILKLNNSVIFLGQRNDIQDLYQVMDCFLFPSLYEGLGMVLIEAQCSNLPCICSKEVPNIAKINDNVKFLDLSVNPEEWANVLIKTINKNRNINTLKVIENKGYNIKKEIVNLEIKYKKLMESKKYDEK